MTNTVTLLLREAQKHVDRGDDCGSLARIVVEVLEGLTSGGDPLRAALAELVAAEDAWVGPYVPGYEKAAERLDAAWEAARAALAAQPLAAAPPEPVAWIAEHESGRTLHLGKSDGWKITAVASVAEAPWSKPLGIAAKDGT